ncbi:MAG: hypothetical protein JW779_02665 [Candidatus Thorarchaeota archaeon]|nr:hypothetical protein [Candidatus Thorarchaeota archaeon]
MALRNRRCFIFALIFTWIILSPYMISVSYVSINQGPVTIMKPAAPTITGPSFYQFENGSAGETIVYTASDASPKNYSITANGTIYDSGIWDGDDITLYLIYLYTRNMIDTLPTEFNFVVKVFNQQNESASVSTTVRVILDESAPIIQSHDNITYEVGSFGHEIHWNITESNPDFYNVTRESNESGTNYTEIASGSWDGDDIIINVDGLNESHWYIYTLFVNDTFGRNATSFVNVTVLPDLTNPVVSSPADVSFEFGSTGHEIKWFVYDSNPKNYTIDAVILYNDTTYGNVSAFHSFVNISQADWSFPNPEGQNITVLLDGLFLGNYSFIITAFDDFERSSQDIVNLTIYKDIRAPIITADDDLTYEEGYTGYALTWSAEESNPLSFNLTLDSTVLLNGTWRGENITINVDKLAVGTYTYNLTLKDYFNATSFAVIVVEVEPDAHNPIISGVQVIQTLNSPSTNNITVQAYVWDLNNISSITIEWSIGNPQDAGFTFETKAMDLAEIADYFIAHLGEYTHGSIVWYKVIAVDNSSLNNVQETDWTSITVTKMSSNTAPAPLYAIVVLLGGLSLLVIAVLYFRTKVK